MKKDWRFTKKLTRVSKIKTWLIDPSRFHQQNWIKPRYLNQIRRKYLNDFCLIEFIVVGWLPFAYQSLTQDFFAMYFPSICQVFFGTPVFNSIESKTRPLTLQDFSFHIYIYFFYCHVRLYTWPYLVLGNWNSNYHAYFCFMYIKNCDIIYVCLIF